MSNETKEILSDMVRDGKKFLQKYADYDERRKDELTKDTEGLAECYNDIPCAKVFYQTLQKYIVNKAFEKRIMEQHFQKIETTFMNDLMKGNVSEEGIGEYLADFDLPKLKTAVGTRDYVHFEGTEMIPFFAKLFSERSAT